MQFDDLITIEHTKLKPAAISTAVDAVRGFILGAEVSQIPAFGHLAKPSVAKYGYRESTQKDALDRLFKSIAPVICNDSEIRSDEHKLYPQFVNKYLPGRVYKRFKSIRGCVTGQGELKKQCFDPIFVINHTLAMMRANISRLIRRTWNTTKSLMMLKNHVDIYIHYHNIQVLKKLGPP